MSGMDAIYKALEVGEISRRDAIEAVLYHPEYGGHRDDAAALVDEWIAQQNELKFSEIPVLRKP